MKRFAPLFAFALTFLFGLHAAAASRVVLLQPADADGRLRDALARTRGELTAAGFVVVVVPLGAGSDTRTALATAAKDAQADAAVAIESIAGGADVWVADRITEKTSVRTVDVRDQPLSEQPRALAIRAVELLRASLVEAIALPPPTGTPPKTVPDEVRNFVEEPTQGPLAGVGAHLGLGIMGGFDGIGPSFGPALKLSYGLDAGAFARLGWAGPLFGAAITGPLGEATIREEKLTLDFGYAPIVDWGGFSPMIWAGAGFYHLATRGELTGTSIGRSDDVWAAAIVGGAGMGYRITPHVMLSLNAEALVALPRPVIAMAGENIASTGRPSILADLGVTFRF